MEIERKYLLQNDDWRKFVKKSINIKQGYISTSMEHTFRVRITDNKSYLTLKGRTDTFVHPEYEYEIPLCDAEEIFNTFCKNRNLEKIRHIVEYKGHIFEIDEFKGNLSGLIFAEVELKSEDEEIDLPDWIGLEVTGDPSYYNSNLIKTA